MSATGPLGLELIGPRGFGDYGFVTRARLFRIQLKLTNLSFIFSFVNGSYSIDMCVYEYLDRFHSFK